MFKMFDTKVAWESMIISKLTASGMLCKAFILVKLVTVVPYICQILLYKKFSNLFFLSLFRWYRSISRERKGVTI